MKWTIIYAVQDTNTMKPLIADPAKSGLPLHSGQISCPRSLFLYIWNLREEDTSLLWITDSQRGPKQQQPVQNNL